MPDENAVRIIREREPGAGTAALAAELDPLLARILGARGVQRPAELDLSMQALLPPERLRNADRAAALLADHVQSGRHIKIVGDFDADGATATALAMVALTAMGAKKVSFLVPNRFDFGYGLTPEIVALALQDDPDLLVTVDNGISSHDGVRVAREAGLKVLVTDHHLPPPELPDADVIVNPSLPDCEFPSKALAGVGVVFYVLCVLRAQLRERGWFEAQGLEAPNMADYLDLVALGTVADVVPLDRNNRVLVQQGLQRIRQGRTRPGIKALIEAAGREQSRLQAQDLGFALGPRINAAGRLDDISIGIRCLLAPDLKSARSLARALEELNAARRSLEQQMTAQGAVLAATVDAVDSDALGLCVYDPGWHQGVVGIVAGRLRERFHRPVIAFADAGDGDELKGSARSINGVHIRDVLEALSSRFPGLILKFGGHAMAAGLSIRRPHLTRFQRAFAAQLGNWMNTDDIQSVLVTDGELGVEQCSLHTARLLARFGPWGQHFPEPLFHNRFQLVHQRQVGQRHLKLTLRRTAADGRALLYDAIAFNQDELSVSESAALHVVYRLTENHYGGETRLQLVVEHLSPA